ncbi:Hypothetical protein SRAE_X000010600 [Strongyloides ratti]|uniref:Uncharacterized protein n=1 Tax=Strongyloides ratti TaxID=34506 RepID=A0A090LLT8_STRRB|nr:Hypothetical protein SRAE_X000010600 [Strongyloides ratti]CEF70775.1 Hypothetical protein SRAE_X000010600 [Strongyloides ratti]
MDIEIIKQLIDQLNDLNNITAVDYEELEFTLKKVLPKGIIVSYLKILPPEKLERLLTEDIKKSYNQLEFAQFLLNEYIEYDLQERLKQIVRIMLMISLQDIEIHDFLEYIMHNKYVISSDNGHQYCCVYVENLYSQQSITKKNKKDSEGILNFAVFEDIIETSKRVHSVDYKKYTIKFDKNIVLDYVLQRNLVKMNQLKRKNPYENDGNEITIKKANTIKRDVLNDKENEVPIMTFFNNEKKENDEC